MKARLIYWHKQTVPDRYVLEMEIFDVGRSGEYASGIRYSLILIDPDTKKRVLMDNHHPKGPHVHLDDQELPYTFVDIDRLVEDFKAFVLEHLGVKI